MRINRSTLLLCLGGLLFIGIILFLRSDVFLWSSSPQTSSSSPTSNESSTVTSSDPNSTTLRPGFTPDSSSMDPDLLSALENPEEPPGLGDSTPFNVEGRDSILEHIAILDSLSPRDARRGRLIIAIADAWAELDPLEGLTWASALQHGEGTMAAMAPLAAMARTDGAAAFAAVNALENPASGFREAARSIVLSHWGQSDFDGAWEAVHTLTDPTNLMIDRQNLLQEQASVDPATAGQALSNIDFSEIDPQNYSGSASTIARELIRTKGQEGLDWAMALPEGPLQTSAVQAAVGAWTQKDPEAASLWVRDFPEGPVRQAAISEMITYTQDRERAFLWASQGMTPGGDREFQLVRSSVNWLSAEPEKARQAIESSSSITNQEREEIFKTWEALEGN